MLLNSTCYSPCEYLSLATKSFAPVRCIAFLQRTASSVTQAVESTREARDADKHGAALISADLANGLDITEPVWWIVLPARQPLLVG